MITDRLKKLRRILGLTQREFAESLGISQGAYSQIEQGGRKLTDRNIVTMSAIYQVRRDWLLTGEGSVFGETEKDKDFFRSYEALSDKSKEYIQSLILQMAELENKAK